MKRNNNNNNEKPLKTHLKFKTDHYVHVVLLLRYNRVLRNRAIQMLYSKLQQNRMMWQHTTVYCTFDSTQAIVRLKAKRLVIIFEC